MTNENQVVQHLRKFFQTIEFQKDTSFGLLHEVFRKNEYRCFFDTLLLVIKERKKNLQKVVESFIALMIVSEKYLKLHIPTTWEMLPNMQ